MSSTVVGLGFAAGIVCLVLAGILLFVPFDGPIGELVFGLVGVGLLTISTGARKVERKRKR